MNPTTLVVCLIAASLLVFWFGAAIKGWIILGIILAGAYVVGKIVVDFFS